MFSKDKKLQITAYKRFVSKEEPEEIIDYYSKANMPSILGSEKFIKWVKDRFPKKKKGKEVPESRLLAPDRERIEQVVCKEQCVDEEILHKSKRGTWNESRSVAIYRSG